MVFVFVSVNSSFTASFFSSAFVLTSLSLRWVSTSIWELNCFRFPGTWSASAMCFESTCTSALLSPWCSLFAGYFCVWNGLLLLLLLLALPIPLQRDLGCGPWCRKPFVQHSISVLSGHTVNAISWYRMISFARILILYLALLSILPNTQHLGCVSIMFHMELFDELCNRNEASPLPGPFREDSMESQRQLDELVSSSFPPGIVPLTRIDWKEHWLPLW